jgi:hypothetical protein
MAPGDFSTKYFQLFSKNSNFSNLLLSLNKTENIKAMKVIEKPQLIINAALFVLLSVIALILALSGCTSGKSDRNAKSEFVPGIKSAEILFSNTIYQSPIYKIFVLTSTV